MTLLTAAIMVDDLAFALEQAEVAAERGADLVELRLDRLAMKADQDPSGSRSARGLQWVGELARKLVQECPLGSIVTCRPVWEGGEYEGEDVERALVLAGASRGPRVPVYVDAELEAYTRSESFREIVDMVVDPEPGTRGTAGGEGPGLILSSHDFEGRPVDLLRRVQRMAEEPRCRVVKVAWRARSLRDNVEAFELLSGAVKPMIALCMGEAGLPSRVLAKKFGGLLTFAAVEKGEGTAPGQPTLAELKALYRWNAIGPETRVYGVVGWPVGHSKSPAYHNARFEEEGVDAVYLPMPIPSEYEHLKATLLTWSEYEPLHFRGASVTIPHKENLLRYAAEMEGRIEPLAERIGAANTLAVRAGGGVEVSNTDLTAAMDAYLAATGQALDAVNGLRVAVLGAGGAARAVAAGFAGNGADVTIYNRTMSRGRALAEELRANGGGSVRARAMDGAAGEEAEVWVNCTPLGMHPKVDATPLPVRPASWGVGTVVFDTIYNPRETRLLREAAAAGCTTIHGDEMFDRQAAAQYELWTREGVWH